ncbi:uncharacterized protein LOC111499802 isoform X2 [Cucurbita maxima]|uniref:Uncharacterized protein LOC111499802 isoform X2 n=1 Tax=Cucurbita maxima TaxID=3661 RepID=A0A6J1L778_CUCMA|nr:uncharacterized protein LOC111499802 isoform X2 [Cucurbita maxima]
MLADNFDPVSSSAREKRVLPFFRGVSEPVELLDRGRELQALGDFNQTLLCFTVEKSHHKYLSELQFQQLEKDAGSDVLSFKQNAIADRPSRKCFQQTEWAINHVPCPPVFLDHMLLFGIGDLIHTSSTAVILLQVHSI